MTERTKGPAVSMRRPPTRGQQDPWTPRKIALRGHLFAPYPRRPTVDGAAHNVHLHGPDAGGWHAGCISISFTFLFSYSVEVFFTLREDQ